MRDTNPNQLNFHDLLSERPHSNRNNRHTPWQLRQIAGRLGVPEDTARTYASIHGIGPSWVRGWEKDAPAM